MPRRERDPAAIRTQRERFAIEIAEGRLDIATAVKRMRKLSGLTQPDFAKHRGISVLTLKRIEGGKGNPTVETLDAIGRIFGLRVSFVHADPEATAQWSRAGAQAAGAETK